MQRRHRNRAFHMLAATIASHCNLNQYPLGDRCLWLRGRIVLPTLIIMAATATDGVRDSIGMCRGIDFRKLPELCGHVPTPSWGDFCSADNF